MFNLKNNTENGKPVSKVELGVRTGLAGVVLAAQALTLVGCAPVEAQPPKPTETTITTPSPEVEEPAEAGAEVIPAGLGDQELGEAMLERINAWVNAGANDDLLMASVEANLSWEEFLPTVADKNRQEFADALFPEDWEQNPDLVAFADSMRDANLNVLNIFVVTAWNGDQHPENIEGYSQTEVFTSAELRDSGDGTRTLDIYFTMDDNSELNQVPDDQLASQGPMDWVRTVSFQTVGDTERVTKQTSAPQR